MVKQHLPEPTVTVVRDDDPLEPGDVVMLPNGALAIVEKIVGRDAYVVEWTKQGGRGPWIYAISELAAAT